MGRRNNVRRKADGWGREELMGDERDYYLQVEKRWLGKRRDERDEKRMQWRRSNGWVEKRRLTKRRYKGDDKRLQWRRRDSWVEKRWLRMRTDG